MITRRDVFRYEPTEPGPRASTTMRRHVNWLHVMAIVDRRPRPIPSVKRRQSVEQICAISGYPSGIGLQTRRPGSMPKLWRWKLVVSLSIVPSGNFAELIRSVTCNVLKAKANDRRTSSPLPR
ncbi:hypothetical protein TNCV_2128631 [Trichonephila clavipes]|nr:hypothetical protein TNCV_2128631 [Trichonephila clavipes]